MQELKRHALAKHLGIPVEDVHESYENHFEVNPRKRKQGDSPDKVRENVQKLRMKLKSLFGDQVDSWTTEFLQVQQLKFRDAGLSDEIKAAAQQLETLQQEESNLKPSYGKLWHTLTEQELDAAWAWKKAQMPDGWIDPPLIRFFSKLIAAEAKLKELRERKQSLFSYNRLDNAIRDSFQWPSRYDNVMAKEYQFYVNMIFWIMSVDSKGQARYCCTSLQAAFNGQSFEDTRPVCDQNDGEYWVLDDNEAEEAWDESLQSYLDECVLSELPEIAQQYFDDDRWKRDARQDGRGHSLSSYDGNEGEITISIKDIEIIKARFPDLSWEDDFDEALNTIRQHLSTNTIILKDPEEVGELTFYIYRTN